MAYAVTTDVPFDRSIADIVKLVSRVGADQVLQFAERDRFTLQFTLADRMVRFRVSFPADAEVEQQRGPRQNFQQVADQLHRQRGRALLLVIKAKLESIETGIETFEQAFLANVIMSDGTTVHERVAETIALEYGSGVVTTLLLGGPA